MDHSSLPTDELVCKCANGGDAALWEEFVRRFHRLIAISVMRVCEQRGGVHVDLVEDLVQETYAKLCAHGCSILKEFVPNRPDAVFAFIKVVALNVAQDYFRSLQAQKRGSGDATVDINDLEQLASTQSANDMERTVLLGEIDRLLNSHTAGANGKRDRAIFWLYYKQGLSSNSIAALPNMDLSVKGVESTLLRLSRAIRQHFSANKRASNHTQELLGGSEGRGAL